MSTVLVLEVILQYAGCDEEDNRAQEYPCKVLLVLIVIGGETNDGHVFVETEIFQDLV